MTKDVVMILLCIALIVSLGINIVQAMLYENNMDIAEENYLDLMDYCEELEDIVEEWEVWIP